MQRTEIESLGEFGLIRRLTEQTVLRQPSSLLGIGDDAAVINPEGKRVVVSTDMLVEGVHFDLSYAPLKHLGYKAVAVNLSDICAMNALPTQVTVSIAVSSRFSVEALDELPRVERTMVHLVLRNHPALLRIGRQLMDQALETATLRRCRGRYGRHRDLS